MQDPLSVSRTGSLRTACQIIRIDRYDSAVMIDLVTLESCSRGSQRWPAGTPLTMAFRAVHLDDEWLELEEIVAGWESRGQVVVLEASQVANGIRYQFTDGDEELLLVLDERPSERDRG